MAKTSGLGDGFLIGGNDLSGDVASLDRISGGPAVLAVTGINTFANERIGGLRDGNMQFTTFFDTATEHPVLSALPTSDVIATYLHGSAVGNPAANMTGKQVNYDPTRDHAGNLTLKVEVQANGFGMGWGQQLTAGAFPLSNFLSTTGQSSGFESGIGFWTQAGNCSIAQTTAQAHSGTHSLALTSIASGVMGAASCLASNLSTQGLAVTPGQQVYCQLWARSAVSARTVQANINWYDNTNTLISTSAGGATDSSSAWTVVTVTGTAPANAAHCRANFQVLSTGAASEVHYVDDVELFLLPASYDTGLAAPFTGDESTFEGGIANWVVGTNCTIAQSSAQAHTGTHCLALTSLAAGQMYAQSCADGNVATQGVPVAPGKKILATIWVRAASTTQTIQLNVNWYTSSGAYITSSTLASATDSSTAWTEITALGTAPATAAFAAIDPFVVSTAGTGEVHYVDDVVVYPAHGGQAYLQLTQFTGTDITVKIQDSSDSITWADVSGLTFTQQTAAPAAQRIAIADGTGIRRYVAATAVSTGGFTSATFCVSLHKNQVTVVY